MTIKATNDLMFKKILSSVENKDILQGFIKDFCGLDAAYEDMHIESPFSIDLYKEASGSEKKIMRLVESDISVELRNLNVIVELQMQRDIHFIARVLHYTFKRFCKNYAVPGKVSIDKYGDPNYYSSLVPVYSVNIVSEKLFPDDYDAMRTFTLYDTQHSAGLGKEWIKISFLELRKTQIRDINLKYWHEFLVKGDAPMKAPANAPAYIKKAYDIANYANLDDDERKIYDEIERYQSKHQSAISTAVDDGYNMGVGEGIGIGIEIGRGEGREEGIEIGRGEGIEIGREEGREEGMDALFELIKQGVPPDEAIKQLKEKGNG